MPRYDSIEYTILCLVERTFPEENNGKLKRLDVCQIRWQGIC